MTYRVNMNQPLMNFHGQPIRNRPSEDNKEAQENTTLRDVIQDVMNRPRPPDNPTQSPASHNPLRRFHIALQAESDYAEWDGHTLDFILSCGEVIWRPIIYGRVSEIFEAARHNPLRRSHIANTI